MNVAAADAAGLLAAALLYVPLLALPGFAVAGAANLLGFRDLAPAQRWGVALLAGLALLPWLDATSIRFLGAPAALAAHAGLAVAGAAIAIRQRCGFGLGPAGWALAAGWVALVGAVWVDIDTGAGLRQPLLVIDLVKHAATTRAIVESGAPPTDPFFAREGRAGYYYFFYAVCALADILGGAWVDARAAVGGLVVWTGVALVALLGRLLDRSGFVRGIDPALARRCLLALLPAAGLDIIPVGWTGLTTGSWMPVVEWWNDQVAWWLTSLIWVPHHVSGLLAAWLGLLVLTDGADRGGTPAIWRILVAGTAFAACAGLSVWVALGAVATVAAWLVWLGLAGRWRLAAAVMAAGLVSLVLAAPHLADIAGNRADGRLGIAVVVRTFGPLEALKLDPVLSTFARVVLLPFNYYVGFGVFASGALLFWRIAGREAAHATETGRLLTVSAVASLAIGGFFASTIIANDLGWRIVLFAEAATFVWTVAAVARWISGRRVAGEHQAASARARPPVLILVLAAIGYATSLHTFVWQRAYPWSGYPDSAFINARPDVDLALRQAYLWANQHLAASLVLQHNPAPSRVFDFGLYSRHRVGVADREAQLFGANAGAVRDRVDALLPVFMATLSAGSVRERAAAAGIDVLVVSAADAVWHDRTSWVWSTKAAYENPLVRMVRIGDL